MLLLRASLVLVLTVLRSQAGSRECNVLLREFNQCTRKAHTDYVAAIRAGDDGRKDFHARKACNYLEQGVEICGDRLVGDCKTEEQVTAIKDQQIKAILQNLQSNVQAWDSDKCPAVKSDSYYDSFFLTSSYCLYFLLDIHLFIFSSPIFHSFINSFSPLFPPLIMLHRICHLLFFPVDHLLHLQPFLGIILLLFL